MSTLGGINWRHRKRVTKSPALYARRMFSLQLRKRLHRLSRCFIGLNIVSLNIISHERHPVSDFRANKIEYCALRYTPCMIRSGIRII